MTDICDEAAALQQLEIERSIAAHAKRARNRPAICEDCEEPLSLPRREAGMCICAICETERREA